MESDSKIPLVKVDTLDEIQPLGRHLILVFREFELELLGDLHTAGFEDITEADLQVLRFVKPEGSRAVEIARLAGVTKQAIGKAVHSLEERRYLERSLDGQDSRAKVISFTPRGRELIDRSISIIEGVERRYERLLGKRQLSQMKTMLRALFQDHLARKTR